MSANTVSAPHGSSTPARALLGLGSNLGDRLSFLQHAVSAIAAQEHLVGVSGVYETEPVGGPNQGPFLNIVVELCTQRSPRQLLELCQELETAAKRVREAYWGPRTLDVDVLWVDGQVVSEPDLVVPHPRMFERAFVMVPLGELAPDLIVGHTIPKEQNLQRIGAFPKAPTS